MPNIEKKFRKQMSSGFQDTRRFDDGGGTRKRNELADKIEQVRKQKSGKVIHGVTEEDVRRGYKKVGGK